MVDEREVYCVEVELCEMWWGNVVVGMCRLFGWI